jgi:hypothetical protein
MAKTASITELPPSPEHERHTRMIKYAIAMSIRVVCLILVFVVPGWWRVIPGIAVVVLPYFAVVVANNVRTQVTTRVQRPGALVRSGDQGGEQR